MTIVAIAERAGLLPPRTSLSWLDLAALDAAVEKIRAGYANAIHMDCYDCDEAQEVHFIVPREVPVTTSHYTFGRCTCIVGNS